MQAKQAQESIKQLELEDGEVIEDKEVILNEVFRFYSNLYKSNSKVVRRTDELESILRLISKHISNIDNETMIKPPREEEVDRVVANLPKEKSPNIDGVTLEVFQQLWPLMRPACMALVQSFWIDGKLISQIAIGVIKLVPKN